MEYCEYPTDLQELMDHHGHLCFGVLLGYKACKYATEIIGESANMTAETVNAGCGNDAVRLILDCREENGKLLDRKGNTQSWAFYNPDEEEGIRLRLNPTLTSQLPKDKDQALMALFEMPGSRVFLVEPWEIRSE